MLSAHACVLQAESFSHCKFCRTGKDQIRSVESEFCKNDVLKVYGNKWGKHMSCDVSKAMSSSGECMFYSYGIAGD